MVGPALERYEILEELGQGGMSVVYRARDKQLSRDVAIKVLHGFLAKQSDARQRFHREAVAVAKLHHPGIVEIFDYSGAEAKESWIVTELLEGVTLRSFVEARSGGILPYPELGALLIAELCRALEHAHQEGVIHRDLKPENVMVTKDGALKLMDFGIAQLKDGERVTVTGTLLGSPAHMAPEVIDGQRPDARSDLFSVGTILYWLCTHRLPFDAANPSALFKRILDGSYEEPQQVEPKIGNGLGRIIKKALARRPEERYPDAGSLLTELSLELESVGLMPVEVVARSYLSNPDRFALDFGNALLERLIAQARHAIREKNLASAMDRLNRAHAIEPEHKEVRALLQAAGRQRSLERKLAWAGASLLGALGAVGIGYAATSWTPEPAPVERAPSFESQPPGSRSGTVAEAIAPRALLAPFALAARDGGMRPAHAMKERRPAEPVLLRSDSSAADAAVELPRPKELEPAPAILRLRIGNSFADVRVDGLRVRQNFFGGAIELSPGRHTLVVEKPGLGAFKPRTLEVGPPGAPIVERLEDGRAQPVSELLFSVPKPGQADRPAGWRPGGDR